MFEPLVVVNVYQSLLQTSENCVSLTLVKEKEMVGAAEVFLVQGSRKPEKNVLAAEVL